MTKKRGEWWKRSGHSLKWGKRIRRRLRSEKSKAPRKQKRLP
jgi:hypothetical protein